MADNNRPGVAAAAAANNNGGGAGPVPDYLTDLVRNDPTYTSVFISLLPDDEPHASAVAMALDRNEYVDEIYLVLNAQTRPSRWRALLTVLETRAKNDNVILIDNTPDSLVENLRREIVAVSAPFFEAMQQNPHTLKVSLSVCLSKEVLTSFLDATTGSLVALNFHLFNIDAVDIPEIAKALDRHESIKVLYMSCCSNTLKLLLEFVHRKTFLECLSFRMNDESLDEAVLPQVLEAASKVELHHIFFRRIQSEAVFREIVTIIPKFRMQNLDIGCEVAGWNVTALKQQLKAAVKKNFCLRKVRCDSNLATDFLNYFDRLRVQFCMQRNSKLADWVENPSTIPKELWPYALKLAVEAGHEPLFRSLHSVAPETGSFQRSRKRKRPVYYDPCPQK
jgi:hypothetical protein